MKEKTSHLFPQKEAIRAIPKIIDELEIQIPRRKSASEMTRKDIENIVERIPAKYLHVIEHGRKSGPRPYSLFYDKWQEKQNAKTGT